MKKLFIVLLCVCCAVAVEAQSKIKFDKSERKAVGKNGEKMIIRVYVDTLSAEHFYASSHSDNGDSTLVRYHSKEKKIKMDEIKDKEREKKINRDGLYISYHSESDTYSETPYVMGNKEGIASVYIKGVLDSKITNKGKLEETVYFYPDGNVWAELWRDGGNATISHIRYTKEYYPSGNIKRNESVSNDGNFLSKEHFTSDGRDTTFHLPFFRMPAFPGGDRILMLFLAKNLHFKGATGRVIARFVVAKEGHLKNVSILKSLDPASDEEVMRVIKGMPNWLPGTHKGEAVDVYFTIPISFRR